MSTYGKKALIWWDYNDSSQESALRYAHTPKEIQLQILKKWYPIGTRIKGYNYLNKSFSKRIHNIIGYEETAVGWSIRYDNKSIDHFIDISEHLSNWGTFNNPIKCFVVEEDRIKIKREHKINRIL